MATETTASGDPGPPTNASKHSATQQNHPSKEIASFNLCIKFLAQCNKQFNTYRPIRDLLKNLFDNVLNIAINNISLFSNGHSYLNPLWWKWLDSG